MMINKLCELYSVPTTNLLTSVEKAYEESLEKITPEIKLEGVYCEIEFPFFTIPIR